MEFRKIIYKSKTMSEQIRKDIDRVKNWKQFLNEDVNYQKFYHHTNKDNLDSILKSGLLMNRTNGKTTKVEYVKSLYGGIMPIFLTSNKNLYINKNDDVTLEVNIIGLKKTSDLPTFEDWLYSVEGIWEIKKNGYCFDEELVPEELWDFLKGDCLTYKQLLTDKNTIDKIIDITQTVAILENIEPNRIKLI
jgi:hypothetical protein